MAKLRVKTTYVDGMGWYAVVVSPNGQPLMRSCTGYFEERSADRAADRIVKAGKNRQFERVESKGSKG